MDDELDRMVVRVRADTASFAKDVAAMRGQLEGPLVQGAENASRVMQGALERFVRSGKLGFDDLRRLALSALADVAGNALKTGISGALTTGVSSLVGSLLGLPGRATGGPVTGGRAYVVGERGPELFVPPGDGRVVAPASRGAVSVTVNVNVPRESSAPFMARTGDQVARAVRRALVRAEADG